MNKKDVLNIFFSKSYETQLNEAILNDADFVVDEYGVLNYVANVIDVPYSDYITYIIENPSTEQIETRHITQSSSFEACEHEMIDVFLSENNRGLDFVSIGKHFTKYIRSNKDQAFRKYGENQVKTSAQLGLCYEYYDRWFLNCIGYIYNKLLKDDRQSLISRNILRDPLYSKIMSDILFKDIDILQYMGCLNSNETKLRRYDSVKRLISICLNECQLHGIKTYQIIDSKKDLAILVREEKSKKTKVEEPLLFKTYDYSLVERGLDSRFEYGIMAAEDNTKPL